MKLAQPDLGELLVYLSVASKVTWRHIGQIFVQGTLSFSPRICFLFIPILFRLAYRLIELLDRSVVWMLDDATGKGHAELAYLEDDEVVVLQQASCLLLPIPSRSLPSLF